MSDMKALYEQAPGDSAPFAPCLTCNVQRILVAARGPPDVHAVHAVPESRADT